MELDDVIINNFINTPNIIDYVCKNFVLANFDVIEPDSLVALYLKDAPNNELTKKYIKDNFYIPINITFLNSNVLSVYRSYTNTILEVDESFIPVPNFLTIPIARNNIPYTVLGIREKSLIDSAIKRIRKICSENKYIEIYYPSDGLYYYKSNYNLPDDIVRYIFANLKFYFS